MRRHIPWIISTLLITSLLACAAPVTIEKGIDGMDNRSDRKDVSNYGIINSVYNYYFDEIGEEIRYGLYSYVLFPSLQRKRTERFLKELFASTPIIKNEKEKPKQDLARRNIFYLPTISTKESKDFIYDGSASLERARVFAKKFYDYDRANEFLNTICSEPVPKDIRRVCDSDLSHGPYIFTYTEPISSLSDFPPHYLFVDFS
jgi:hypothetical protein